MLLQLFSRLGGGTTVGHKHEPKDNLRRLIVTVNEELARTEALFNLAEDDALLDTTIYQIKSLTAYQEFLLRAIRENELDAEAFLTEAATAGAAPTIPTPKDTETASVSAEGLRASAPSC